MQLSELQSLIGRLTNDPNNDRYTLSDINTELDNTQNDWNLEIKIIKDTVTVTVVDGTRQYALSGLTGTPISFPRVTHKGLELEKKSKSFFDLYTSTDWTQDEGTPIKYFIEAEDPDTQYITVYPTPKSEDAGAYLVVEYVKAHTAMSASTDVPFMSGTSSNYVLRPYDYYLCYDVSARLLARDTSQINGPKINEYKKIADDGKSQLTQVFKALEKEEPLRLKGGRYF